MIRSRYSLRSFCCELEEYTFNMAENDFFNIKGLGDWPEGSEAPPPPDTEPKPQRPYQHPRSNKKSPKKPILTILIAVVVVALAAGAFVFGSRYKKQPAKASTSSVQPSTTSLNPSQPAATPNTSSSASAGMEQYVAKGSDLNLSFVYPTGWSANPASGITTDQTITLTSPQTTITAAGGSSVTGEVVLTVRPGTAPLNELTANNPTAPQASSQIAYDRSARRCCPSGVSARADTILRSRLANASGSLFPVSKLHARSVGLKWV